MINIDAVSKRRNSISCKKKKKKRMRYTGRYRNAFLFLHKSSLLFFLYFTLWFFFTMHSFELIHVVAVGGVDVVRF